jgi:hypothetical protein
VIVIARLVWLATGLLWAARSLVGFANPDYWDPVTALDWIAIWLYSAAWLMLAASVLLLGRLVGSREVTVATTIVAAGAIAAGVANGIEDGIGVSWFGTLYVVGFMVGWLGLLGLAATYQRARRTRLAGLAATTFLGILMFNVGGGFIILLALGGLAVAPSWFMAAAPMTDLADGTLEVG